MMLSCRLLRPITVAVVSSPYPTVVVVVISGVRAPPDAAVAFDMMMRRAGPLPLDASLK